MEKKILSTEKAPPPVGPYSQAVIAGDFIFAAGQLGIDPQSGELVEGIEAQTRQVLTNLSAVLEAASSSLDRVVKATIFLAHVEDFAAMNGVYGQFFPLQPPARSTVVVGQFPRGILVEIEVIALRT